MTDQIEVILTPDETKIDIATAPNSVVEAGDVADADEESQISPRDCMSNHLPSYFYCPVNSVIMTDPVVLPNGTTCDRSAVAEIGVDLPVYPNRAFQECLEQQKELRNKNFKSITTSASRRIIDSLRGLARLGTIYNTRPLSDALYCPITQDLFIDPVIDPEGNTFEREAIMRWITQHGNSPVTRTPMNDLQLYDNTVITILLMEESKESNRSGMDIHPSVRRWKTEIASQQRHRSLTWTAATLSSTHTRSPSTLSSLRNNNERAMERRRTEEAARATTNQNNTTRVRETMSRSERGDFCAVFIIIMSVVFIIIMTGVS